MLTFIADFFETVGGAEQNDSVLIQHLMSKYKVDCVLSHLCTISSISESSFLIIGNFINLHPQVKNYITNNKKYVIYEHDHKYVKTRDPSRYSNFKIPESDIVNYEFYKNAKKVVCLGQKQVDIIRENLKIENLHSISSSLWTSEKLDFIRSLSDIKKPTERYGIVQSSNPIKNTNRSIQFCTQKNINYELFSSSDTRVFLEKMNSYQGIVFFPGVLESMCRLVVEAKMLNCKVITNPKMLGAYYEPWFSLSGKELNDTISNNVNSALKKFEELIDE
jgi:hypothetical protein